MNKMRSIANITVGLTVGILLTTTGIDASKAQKQLFQYLFQDYNPRIRPVQNDTDTLLVEFGLTMSQLIDVDEKNQIISTNVWLKQAWTDYRLIWDPADFENINVLQVPANKLWTPDIVLFNNADGKYEVTLRTNVLLYPMGYLYWLPPAIYKSSCNIDVRYFPLDQQICDLKFGSWTYDGRMIELIPMAPRVDLEDYWESGEWDIVDSPTLKNIIQHGDQIYSDITINLLIRRKPLFYTVNLILPCVLISCLTVLVFYLPSDSQERITLCISILLALTVFLLLLADIIPPTSLMVPLIGRYLIFTMMLVSLSIVICVIILNIHFRTPTTHIMSPWTKKVFLEVLPPIFFMKRPPKKSPDQVQSNSESSSSSLSSEMNEMQLGSTETSSGCSDNQQSYHRPKNVKTGRKLMDNIGHVDSGNESACSENVRSTNNDKKKKKRYHREFLQIVQSAKKIANYLKEEDAYNSVVDDWKYVAMVIDRICLWVFLIFVICGTCGIILSAPLIFMPRVTQESAL